MHAPSIFIRRLARGTLLNLLARERYVITAARGCRVMECRAMWNPNRDIAHRNTADVGLWIDFRYDPAPCRAFYT